MLLVNVLNYADAAGPRNILKNYCSVDWRDSLVVKALDLQARGPENRSQPCYES